MSKITYNGSSNFESTLLSFVNVKISLGVIRRPIIFTANRIRGEQQPHNGSQRFNKKKVKRKKQQSGGLL